MRKNQLILILFLLSQSSWLWAGNPVVIIRCGFALRGEVETAERGLDALCGDGYISIDGHCYLLTPDDGCPDLPGVTNFISVTLDIGDGEMVSVCVPDCSDDVCNGITCFAEDVRWDFGTFSCGCDDTTSGEALADERAFFVTCGCPPPLVPNEFSFRGVEFIGEDFCALPVQNCFNLGIDVDIEPFICDTPTPEDEVITIIVKPAGGGLFTPGVDAITIEDLENCNLLNGTQELLDVVGLFDGGQDLDRPAFVANDLGCIEIQFTRDPTIETVISFQGDMNEAIVIPVCPRVFDPCACRPENIVDADGIVEFWFDELTFTGNPDADITVAANNIPAGFLTADTQLPFAVGDMLGTTNSEGLLTIPFFRTPGFDTDVELQDPTSQTASLTSTCTLAVDECITEVVPTLGEWGIIVLSLLLMITSVVAFRYKESNPTVIRA